MTPKICTSIDQSKKLMELGVNTNTADMSYIYDFECGRHICELVAYKNVIIPKYAESDKINNKIPAWSISALLSLIPSYLGEFEEGIDFGLSKSINGEWYSAHYLQWQEDGSLAPIKTVTGDTVVDAVYEMLCWLLENKKL